VVYTEGKSITSHEISYNEFTSLLYLQIHLAPGFNPSFHGGNGEVWGEGEGVHLEASLPRTSIGDGE